LQRVAAVLILKLEPEEAVQIATILVDGSPSGTRVELATPKRVHVSVTALGFHRFSKDVDVGDDTELLELVVQLQRRKHKKSRTLPVTLGMSAASVIAWLIRRGR
jgi:hypothetical protein